MSNGHVYPEVDKSNADLKYAEHKYLYRNLQNGRFEEVTDKGGPGILETAPARGCAFGDWDNDGDIDIAVNCVNAIPQTAALRFHAQAQLGQDSAGRTSSRIAQALAPG